jgi:hypothetical protein
VSVVHSVCLSHNTSISAPTLAYLMEHCQSLKALTLEHLKIDEDSIHVLGDYSRPDLEIVLDLCTITGAGASTLAEVLGHNQGPTKLTLCHIDNSVIANGLRGNSRLQSLEPRFSNNSNREVLAIAGALRENKGLVRLDLAGVCGFNVTAETWGAVCDSLHAHPTLEILDLSTPGGMAPLPPAVIKFRMQVLLNMMKVNTTIHTIHLNSHYSRHEIFRKSVIPYLETNRLRPRVRAIQKTRPIPYRAKVLGRALLSARTDTNRFWMLLSGNAEVAFPSSTATIAAAGNLSDTSTTAAATSTANIAATALTSTVTDSLLTAAAETAVISAATPSTDLGALAFAPTDVVVVTAAAGNVAAPSPSAGQKRKARL